MIDLSIIPVHAISEESIELIGNLLNSSRVAPASNGFSSDWAEFLIACGIPRETVISADFSYAKFNNIFDIISEIEDLTLQNLIDAFKKIGRHDVIQKSLRYLERDAELYVEKVEKSKYSKVQNYSPRDPQILTHDDVFRLGRGESNQKYDAFLLYADEDIDFAQGVIDILEKENNYKLCLKDRDLVAGISFEHAEIMRLISERCRRLIVIISPEFLKSHYNTFFLNFAHISNSDRNGRRIIPVVYKKCEKLPTQLLYFSKIYYEQDPTFFWDKLVKSVKITQNPPLIMRSPTKNFETKKKCCPSMKGTYQKLARKFTHLVCLKRDN